MTWEGHWNAKRKWGRMALWEWKSQGCEDGDFPQISYRFKTIPIRSVLLIKANTMCLWPFGQLHQRAVQETAARCFNMWVLGLTAWVQILDPPFFCFMPWGNLFLKIFYFILEYS